MHLQTFYHFFVCSTARVGDEQIRFSDQMHKDPKIVCFCALPWYFSMNILNAFLIWCILEQRRTLYVLCHICLCATIFACRNNLSARMWGRVFAWLCVGSSVASVAKQGCMCACAVGTCPACGSISWTVCRMSVRTRSTSWTSSWSTDLNHSTPLFHSVRTLAVMIQQFTGWVSSTVHVR